VASPGARHRTVCVLASPKPDPSGAHIARAADERPPRPGSAASPTSTSAWRR